MNITISEDRRRHGRHLAVPAIYAFIVVTVTMQWLPEMPRIVNLLMFAALMGLFYAYMQHDRELCDRCMAKMPLDPDAAVRRNRRLLKARHHPLWVLGPMVALVVTEDLLPYQSWEEKVAGTLVNAVFAIFITVATRHQHLQPWCPWCRGGGGDDDALAPVAPPNDRIPSPTA